VLVKVDSYLALAGRATRRADGMEVPARSSLPAIEGRSSDIFACVHCFLRSVVVMLKS
jgi:hypothetical protein